MATTKITSPDLFNLESLNTALRLPSGSTDQRPTSPSTGEWRYNTTTNLVEFWDGGAWRELLSEDIPPTPSENFNVVLYTGNGSTQSITGVGFKPDFVWVKVRSTTGSGPLADSTRGTGKAVYSNLDSADYTFPAGQGVTSFDADGFSIGDDSTGNGGYNGNGKTYVAWCWKANGGTTSSNTDGSTTSTVQANTKAGFSIVTYTGTGANATVGHGLGAQPYVVITKGLDLVVGTTNWRVYTNALGGTKNMKLNGNDAAATGNSTWNDTDPTSSVFSLGTSGDPNGNGATYVAYCFAPVAGYSSFGKYQGNGVSDGPLVVTGFEPAFLIVKNTSITSNWRMVDNKRSPLNHRQRVLFPNLNNGEANTTDDAVDFLSTGFKISNDDSSWNANADQFLYIAFASDPTAAPTLAASFSNVAYFGDGQSNRAITGLGFSPSWVWIKNRSAARDHMEFDNTRLLGSELVPGNYTNLDAADFNTTGNDFNSFDTDGFTIGQDPYTNENGSNMVAWTWKANPIPAINNDGDIQSIVSANQAAGFSIVTYTGTSTVGATIGHGLSAAPDAVIIKCMNTGSTNWINYYETIGVNDYLTLNLNNALDTFSNWFTSSATTFTFGAVFGNTNTTGRTYVAYCFKSIAGFSKMGSYSGTGSAGNAQNVGFTPAWVMIKRTNSISDWYMFDTARGDTSVLLANSSAAQFTNTNFNLTSTGFDFDGTDFNEAGSSWIYMAFKENIATPALPAGEADFLVVAGGGGGGGGLYGRGAGGAGAGGLRTSFGSASGGGSSAESNITLASGTYTITIGTGGSSGSFGNTGGTGNNSSITGSVSITSDGGGYSASGTNGAGGAGGSGGSGYDGGGAATANQGYPGIRNLYNSTYYAGGGGGAAGQGGVAPSAGNGGPGLQVNGTYYAGGGGTGQNSGQGPGGAGIGGGGQGQDLNFYTTPCDGDANTGGGGGGGTYTSSGVPGTTRGGQGGSGVVILQMRTSDYSGVTTGSPSVSVVGGLITLTYTGSGTYVHS